MRSKMTLTALAAAALLGTTLMASAQTQPSSGASSQGNVGPNTTTNAPMNNSGTMSRDSMSKDGTTTGSGTGSMNRDGMTKSTPTTGPGGQNNNAPTGSMAK